MEGLPSRFGLISTEETDMELRRLGTKVFVDGRLIGYSAEPKQLVKNVREIRRRGEISSEVNIAPRCMYEMVSTNSKGITVTHRNEQGKLRPAELESRGKSKRSSVERVEGMEIQIATDPGGTSDTGDNNNVIFLYPQVLYCPDHGAHYSTVTTARTPDVGKESLSYIIFHCHCLGPLSLDDSHDVQDV